MNITHFVENLNRGGLERMVLDLVRVQHARGHRCRVICLFECGSLAHELTDLGIEVTACGKRRGLDMRALGRARRWIAQHRTEVLHTHNAAVHYQAVLATVGLGIRCVINTRHGMGGIHHRSRAELLYRLALLRTDRVVMVCRAAARAVAALGVVPRRKLEVVPNGIGVGAFHVTSPAMRESLRQALDLPSQSRIVGTVGRLNWAKDQAGLVSAFVRVRARLPEAVLVLIGDGELRAELEHQAAREGLADHVHFLGDRDDVRELLQGLELFVLSSLSEGYSMALLEASATALPIIATDVGGNGEIVSEGRTGRLVPASDPAALADAMIAMLRYPQRAAELGIGARQWVHAQGSLETMADRYDDLYAEAQPAEVRV